jgi:predicted transcriptional regulator of viral defense system
MTARDDATRIFRKHGILRTSEALDLGIHPETLYAMRDAGELEQLARGLYQLADASELSQPDLVIVTRRAPNAVVCLVSALSLHEMTTEIPHAVHLAVLRGRTRPVIRAVRTEVHTFHAEAFKAGIQVREVDGANLRLYSPEKTLVDVFRFRNRLGLDVFLEALELFRRRTNASPQEVLDLAPIWRVEQTIRPYLEQAFA